MIEMENNKVWKIKIVDDWDYEISEIELKQNQITRIGEKIVIRGIKWMVRDILWNYEEKEVKVIVE